MKKTGKNKKSVSSTTNKTSPEALKIIRNEVEYERRLRRKDTNDELNTKRKFTKKPKNTSSLKNVTSESETLGIFGNSIIVLTIFVLTLKIIHSNTNHIVDKFPSLEGVLLKYEYFISNNIIRITDSKIVEKIIYLINYFAN